MKDYCYLCYRHFEESRYHCKLFRNVQVADNYCNDNLRLKYCTTLIPINQYIPIIFHTYILNRSIYDIIKIKHIEPKTKL